MNSAICAAIAKRAVVTFSYDQRQRTVEPYAHGISTTGVEVLRAFQTAGGSGSGQPMGWRLFSVSKIEEWRDTGAIFIETRPGYNPRDAAMRAIHCHV